MKKLIALLLAVMMCLSLTACIPPSNDPTPETPPQGESPDNTPEYDEAYVAALITKLEEAIAQATANQDEALQVLSDYYDTEHDLYYMEVFNQYDVETGEKLLAAFELQMEQIESGIRTTYNTKVEALNKTIGALQYADNTVLSQIVAEAEILISEHSHSFDITLVSREYIGMNCPDMMAHKICTLCNAVVSNEAEHQWEEEYSWNVTSHWTSCTRCSETTPWIQHTLDEQGVCTECGYHADAAANILVIESIEHESDALCDMIDEKHTVTVVNIKDALELYPSGQHLAKFDEVILVNVSNDDMPEDFDSVLYNYVNELGGGLFTICGNEEDDNPNDDNFSANAFTRDDMYGTLYQEMLPVDIINYTPSLAVIFIIDTSSSMYMEGAELWEESKLYYAMLGAEAGLDALTERDFVGVMTLEDTDSEEVQLIPRPQRGKILEAIANIPEQRSGGQTYLAPALERAGSALMALEGVAKRHIILVTDGEIYDSEMAYGSAMMQNAEMGITMSIVGVNCVPSAARQMREALETYAGADESSFYNLDDVDRIPSVMRQFLSVPEIKDTNYYTFVPTVADKHITAEGFDILGGINLEDMPTLDGFYGARAKEEAQVILNGEYVPIYAQWKFGEGKVGSFMCDLNGTWSSDFINSEEGRAIINNIILALLNSIDN